MRIRCYYTESRSEHALDQLFNLVVRSGGWIENLSILGMNVYMPEAYVDFLYLIDPDIKPLPLLDYLA